MSDLIERMGKDLERVALEVVTLECGDIPAMGKMMNCLCRLEEDCRETDQPAFQDLTLALKGYLERLILAETDDPKPMEEGIDRLQAVYRSISNQETFKGEIIPSLVRFTALFSQ